MLHHQLVDRSEDGVAVGIEHVDAHAVAELQPRREFFLLLDGLHGARFGQAGETSLVSGVRDGAGREHGAGAERPGLGGMRDQVRVIEAHVGAAVGLAEQGLVDVHADRALDAAAVPGRAQFVWRDGHRRERGRGLAVDEAEVLGDLRRDEIAQRDVVGQHDEADVLSCPVVRRAGRHVAKDDGHLGLEVDAPVFAGGMDGIAGADEVIGVALVHHRVFFRVGRHLGAACLAHQFGVRQVGGGVQPLVGARQGRGALPGLEREVA